MRRSDHDDLSSLLLLMAFVGGMILGATFCERGFWLLLGW